MAVSEKIVKVIFGETHAGSIRVMIGSEEVSNVRSVRLLETKPGELPEIEIKMLAPKLEIEDKTKGGITEMEEVPLNLREAVNPKTSSTQTPSTSKKSGKQVVGK